MNVTYRAATEEDTVSLCPRLRKADVEELTLSCGPDILPILKKAVVDSNGTAMVALEGDKVICLWGVVTLPTMGVPWMVGSPEMYKYAKRLVKDCKKWVEETSSRHSFLTNCVHVENHASIEWLKRLGFTIGATIPQYGVGKAPFYQFYMVNTNV